MTRSLKDIQQDFASSSGYRSEVIWDLLSADHADILKNKIKELIPDQEKGQKTIEGIRETLFNNVWAQRKFTNGNSLTAIIYVLVTKEPDFNKAKDSTEDFSCHPVFRARKCVANSDSAECCMVFVDEVGRVYQNWQSYVTSNVLPAGTMVAPQRGIYTFDEHGTVQLDTYGTPASTVRAQVLGVADTTSAVGGFLSACVPIAALLSAPVTAPIMAMAAGVGLAAAGYSTVRSGLNLADRSWHEQSIGLGDRQARNSWLGVVGGAVGFGAAGATRAMTTAAAAGREISALTELAVNGMNISSIVLSGSGVTNGVLDMILKYKDGEGIALLDVVQLSASLVLFTHSVSNMRLASTIINDTRNSTIQSYRQSLSNRQRRMFDKISKETVRIRGATRGKIDIIRSVNDIPSKQYLNDLYKINKNLNEQKVRPAFGAVSGESVVLNDKVPVDTQVLRDSVQRGIGPDVLGQVNQPIPLTYQEGMVAGQTPAARLLYTVNIGSDSSNVNLQRESIFSVGARALSTSIIVLANGVEIALEQFGIRLFENIVNAESFENVVTTMASVFNEEIFRFMLRLSNTFIESMLDEVHSVLRTFIAAESVLYRIFLYCWERYATASAEFLQDKTLEILEAVKQYYMSLNPNSFPELLTKCKECQGWYAIWESVAPKL